MSIKIIDKRFLKYVNETYKDFLAANYIYGDVLELKNILDTKELRVNNVGFLFTLINKRKKEKNNLAVTMALGCSFEEGLKICNDIQKEHEYMEKYLFKYFNYEEIFPNMVAITYKGGRNGDKK